MEENKHITLFKQLFTLIEQLFDHQEFTDISVSELRDIFYKNLSEMLQLSFDIQISSEKLDEFIKQKGKDADETAMAQFIIDTIENDKSYILLNYYLYEYLQTYLGSMKEEKTDEVMKMMVKEGLSENELQFIIDQYQQMVAQEKLTHANP
jgi:hypothetical protein